MTNTTAASGRVRVLVLVSWGLAVAVWLFVVQARLGQASSVGELVLRGRSGGDCAVLELIAFDEQVVVLPERSVRVGGDGMFERLAAVQERPGLRRWRCRGRVELRLQQPELKALGLRRIGESWIGLAEQVWDGARGSGRFFLLEAEDIVRIGRFVALDAGAARLVAAASSSASVEAVDPTDPATDAQTCAPILVTTHLDMLRFVVGRIADHPLSNLVICPKASEDRPEELAGCVDFLMQRVDLRDRVFAGQAAGQDATLAVVAAVADSLGQQDIAAEQLLGEAARHLAMQRMRAEDVVALLRGAGDDLSRAWIITRIAGPAWHLYGSGRLDLAALKSAAIHMWSELERTLQSAAPLDPLQLQEREPSDTAPDLVLFGRMNGVVDDCGCKGVDSGGLARLVEAAGSELAGTQIVSAGALFASLSSGRSDPESVATMGNLLVELSTRCRLSLNLNVADLATLARMVDLSDGLADVLAQSCITCNVKGRADGLPVGRARRVVVGSKRWAIVGLCGKLHPTIGRREKLLAASRFTIEDAATTLTRVLGDLADEQGAIDGVVLVTSGLGVQDLVQCREIAGDRLRLVLTSSIGDPSWLEGRLQARPPVSAIGGVPLVGHALSSKGITCLTLGAHGWSRESRLLPRTVTDERVVELIRRLANVRTGMDLLESQGVDVRGTIPFVGSVRCASCHVGAHEQWQGTPHATAYDTLVEMQRHHQDVCVACHVTGFEVGGYRPVGDAMGSVPSTQFEGVGCEACHGPGGRHVLSPAEHDMFEPTIAVCQVCHTPDHSNLGDGTAAWYWRRVQHR